MSDYIHYILSKSCHCLLFLHLMQSLKNMFMLKCRHLLKPFLEFCYQTRVRVGKEKFWQLFLICFDVSVSIKFIHKERTNIVCLSNPYSKHLPQKEMPQTSF